MIGSEQSIVTKGVFQKLFLEFFGSWSLGDGIHFLSLRNALPSIPLHKVHFILDVGCGSGMFTFYLSKKVKHAFVYGIDSDQELIGRSKEIQNSRCVDNIAFFAKDVLQIHYDNFFDMVLCIDVLEHISMDRIALQNIRNALRPGGWLLLHVPLTPQWRFFKKFKTYEQKDHVRDGYDLQALLRMIKTSGFRVKRYFLTFGILGAMAWELGIILLKCKPIFVMSYPFLFLLSYIDSTVSNRAGNCIFLLTQRA